jgi:L-lactate dehydrogenase complex protein LldG
MIPSHRNKDPFIARIRRALDHPGNSPRKHEPVSVRGENRAAAAVRERMARRTRSDRMGLLERLTGRAAAAGMAVTPCPGMAAARRILTALVGQISSATDYPVQAIAWRHPLVDSLAIESALADLDPPVRLHRAESSADDDFCSWKHRVADALIGITSAEWCLAETATMVARTSPGWERSVSILPPVNICVLGLDALIADLGELYALLGRGGAASGRDLTNYMSLISGPSATRDIESLPVTGAHGPREVHILVMT